MSSGAQVVENPWGALRALTAARIALGRSGISLPTEAQLAFQLAHARARDAVHAALDAPALAAALAGCGLPLHIVDSACPDRATYLQRPDLGRRLGADARAQLAQAAASAPASGEPYELALVIADGLSALAIEVNAQAFLAALLPLLAGWRLAPLTLVRQGRVAIGDDIGQALGARAVVVMIGERPGLSSPDSMGLYLTWAPRPGRLDAERNCISNIRPAGLSHGEAAARLAHLLAEARRRGLSGVALKDETEAQVLPGRRARNFLLR